MADPSESGSIDQSNVDRSRRRFLTTSTVVVGGAGAIALTIPLISNMSPSARARAAGAPVEVDISKLEAGQKVTVKWRGKPVWVVRRTAETVAALDNVNALLADPDSQSDQQPDYTRNTSRALKEEYLVLVGVCTHLGCSPTFRPELAPEDLGEQWQGGFYCPCHGSRFDMAGRVFKGAPAPTNLEIPPYRYVSDGLILVGEDTEAA